MGITEAPPDPNPAAERRVQPALGSPRGPFPASWQDGTEPRDTIPHLSPARGSAPGACGAASLCQPWAPWHRGDEKSVSCYSRPLCPWQSTPWQCPGEMLAARSGRWRRGDRSWGDPVPCGNPAGSVHAGHSPGRLEEPKCHRCLLFELPAACHALTHPQDGRDAAAKAAGLGRTARVHTEPQLPPAAQPLRPPRGSQEDTHWGARLLQDLLPVGAISSLQRDIYGLGIVSGQSELGWVWQPP